MIYLLLVSFIWAFSFGLIKGNLTGLDSNFVSFARMALSLAVFAPFLRRTGLRTPLALQLIAIGAVQYGLMYLAYIYSFQFLQAYQVALFTIFTPLYVTLIHDLLTRRLHGFFLLTACLAIVGTGIIVYRDLDQSDLRLGFFLLQFSNICFAFGQTYYRRLLRKNPALKDHQIFGLLYLGATLVTLLAAGYSTGWSLPTLSTTHVLTLLYLGILASGICFFLWNYGAKQVDAGALAILNNLKVPLAVACSALFFHETVDLQRLLLGGAFILGALFLNESLARKLYGENA
ncbi:MAG: EamA family transporter [Desulfuromonadales bacterium]|uniref:EamA family transporter n=1 Tax=Desulfuromonas sp. KJ2020 TaxID=2919173 RepID=UPI0003232FB8|nr:EamA family transporter [Desulfuromonas sp. KJ2020]MCP3176996.1 EamA family transporter [Desulfuromonas sp. KJ2020]